MVKTTSAERIRKLRERKKKKMSLVSSRITKKKEYLKQMR